MGLPSLQPVNGLYRDVSQTNHSLKLKTYSFAVIIILGIGGLTIGSVGLAGIGSYHSWWYAGALKQLSLMVTIPMVCAGGVIALTCLTLLIISIKNKQTLKQTLNRASLEVSGRLTRQGSFSGLDQPLPDKPVIQETSTQQSFDGLPEDDSPQNSEQLTDNGGIEQKIGVQPTAQPTFLNPNLVQKTQEEEIREGLSAWIAAYPSIGSSQVREIIECFKTKSVSLKLIKWIIETLPSLPPVIGKLTHLQHLDLSGHNLTSLPSEIAYLTQLKTLFLNSDHEFNENCLMSFPMEIVCLTQLEILDLSWNRLNNLPSEISHLACLKTLILKGNGLTSFPSAIACLSQLQDLDLSENGFMSISPEIACLTQLKTLRLYDNQLTSLPREICGLKRLHTLQLFGNCFTSFPMEIICLAQLEILDLSRNSLNCLPPEISRLACLKTLNLLDCVLTSLPTEIACLTQLMELNLWGNHLTFIPLEICLLSQLHSLRLNNNRLVSLPEEIIHLGTALGYDEMHRRIHGEIFLAGNPLSHHVIENMSRVMNVDDYTGPHIYYSIPEERIVDERSLDELLEELFKAANEPPFELVHLRQSESPELLENLHMWLSKLSFIGDYKTKRKELSQLIYQLLMKAETKAEFRETFWNCINEAIDTCGDRMALYLIHLDVNFQIVEAVEHNDLKRLAYLLGHGSWALRQLEEIAQNKVKTLHFVDEIEVYLAYPIKLKAVLNMPFQIESMLYFACSSLKVEDLKMAEEIVKGKLSDRDAYCAFLSEDQTWQKALKKSQPNFSEDSDAHALTRQVLNASKFPFNN